MKRAHRSPHPWSRWLLGLGILLAACAQDSTSHDPTLYEEVEGGAHGEGDDGGYADKFWSGPIVSLTIPERSSAPTLEVALSAASKHMEAARDVFRSVRYGETVAFAVRLTKGDSVSFSLPAAAFLGGIDESALLVPRTFDYSYRGLGRNYDYRFDVDQDLLQQELRSLHAVEFSSFARTVRTVFTMAAGQLADMTVSRAFSLEHEPAAYQLLARLYYTLVVGPLSDAAQMQMANARATVGDLAWAFAAGYRRLRAYARRRNLINPAVPLIFTAANVAAMAYGVDPPVGSFLELVVFLCAE